MDLKTLLDNLHEEVSCSVCMCKYTDPKQLPCLHSFCLHCLNGIQRTSASRDTIACPECRQEFRIPGNRNLSALPTNFRINSLLDVLAIKECNTTGVKCGNCERKTEQSFYCFQCFAFWCDNCISLHNGIRVNKDHHALELKDFQDQDFENILKRPVFCGKPGHEKKELEFFCKSCEVAICYSCVATLHDGHAKMLLDEAANERKLQVKAMIECKKQSVLQKMDKIAKIQGNCVNIQAQVDSVKRDAQVFADKMIAAIEAKKQEICNDVEKKVKESLERLGNQQCKVENQVKVIETEIEKAEEHLKRSTSAEIAQLDKSFNRIFQEEVCDDGEQINCEDLRHFIFVENGALAKKTNTEGIGSFRSFISKTKAQQSSAEGKGISEATVGLEAEIVVTTKTAEGIQCYEQRDYVAVEIRNRQGHDCATEVQVQDNKDGTYTISYFAKETGACQATVKVNGEHIRRSPFKVQVKTRHFKPVLCFGQQGSSVGKLNGPWGVAVNKQNEIVVSDRNNNRIQVFSSNGTCLGSLGREGDQQGQFAEPCGIAFHGNNNIVVADRNNHRVQILSEQGDFLSQFGEEGILDHQLKFPLGLSIDSNGNFIVADSRNNLIKIFSPEGQLLHKIGGDGSLLCPFHCIQHEKYLVVSDFGDNSIKVFDREGNFIHKFGKKGQENGEFIYNGCLSMNKAGQLMVCDMDNNRVQVFEMSGKFVTKFGTFGSNTGQFYCPVSVGVLTDGKIVVIDSNNNRIQIFE